MRRSDDEADGLVDYFVKLIASMWVAPLAALFAAVIGFVSVLANGYLAAKAVWTPLSTAKIISLSDTLKAMPTPEAILVTYDDYTGKALAESISEACRRAGWLHVQTLKQDGYGEGLVVGRSQRALALRNAIALATGYDVKGEFRDSDTEVRTIAIGPKPK